MHRSASFVLLVTAVVLFLLSSSAFARVAGEKRQAAVHPSCYSPTGSDCYWYRDCLEKKIPCQGTKDDYAIAYAEKFCYKYRDYYGRFSSQGRQWVDAVRRCLQVRLGPVLSTAPPCREIKSKALDSHVPCYLTPGYGAPGLCALPEEDIRVINGIISSALCSAFWDTIKGGLRVATSGGCFIKLLKSLF